MQLVFYLASDIEKLRLSTVSQFQKYLLVTCYAQNETRTKPELSVGISNKTVQNRLGRRMVRRLSGLFER